MVPIPCISLLLPILVLSILLAGFSRRTEQRDGAGTRVVFRPSAAGIFLVSGILFAALRVGYLLTVWGNWYGAFAFLFLAAPETLFLDRLGPAVGPSMTRLSIFLSVTSFVWAGVLTALTAALRSLRR